VAPRPVPPSERFVAGSDMFGTESNGDSIASQYRALGLSLRAAEMDRVSGWSALLQRFGDPAAGIKPTLFIHKRCKHLLECLPYLQHDPDRPGDILKTNVNEERAGGDDAADALRYMIATKSYRVHVVQLRGL
jgi:phage terminase large subunit